MRNPDPYSDLDLFSGRGASLGEKILEMPEERRNAIMRVNIGYNKLVAVVPEVSLLRNLRDFYGTANFFTKFPEVLLQCPNLELISLTRNHIESVPPQISVLRNLSILNVEYNNVSVLPSTLSKLTNLKMLAVSGNRRLPHEILSRKHDSREKILLTCKCLFKLENCQAAATIVLAIRKFRVTTHFLRLIPREVILDISRILSFSQYEPEWEFETK